MGVGPERRGRVPQSAQRWARLRRVASAIGLTVWPLLAALLGSVLAIPIVRLFIATILNFGLVTAAFFLLNFAARLLAVNFDNPGPVWWFLITVVGLIAFHSATGAGYTDVPLDRALGTGRGASPIGRGDR